MKIIEVVAAIIIVNDKILCTQRGQNKYKYLSNKYEFPGGKIENGESKVEALKREILEELRMEIIPIKEFIKVIHKYSDFKLIMYSYICTCKHTSIELSEHVDFKWLHKDELKTLDWAAADIPIVESLILL